MPTESPVILESAAASSPSGHRRRSSLSQVGERAAQLDFAKQLYNEFSDKDSSTRPLKTSKTDSPTVDQVKPQRRQSLPATLNMNATISTSTTPRNEAASPTRRKSLIELAPGHLDVSNKDGASTPTMTSSRRGSIRRASLKGDEVMPSSPTSERRHSRRASLASLGPLPDKSWCDFTKEPVPTVWKKYAASWEDDKLLPKNVYLMANDLWCFYNEQLTSATKQQNPRFADNQVEAAVHRQMKLVFNDRETRYEQTLVIEKLILRELSKDSKTVDKHQFYLCFTKFITQHFDVQTHMMTKKDMKCAIM